MAQKNIAEGAAVVLAVGEGFTLLRFENTDNDIQLFSQDVDSSFIQFHFCLKGAATFSFNKGSYALDVREDHTLLLYNPQRDLPLNIKLFPNVRLISILISIKRFHSLFSEEANSIHFLSEANQNKKYYNNKEFSPAIAIVLNQLFNYNLHPSLRKLYSKGKIYELLSLYFNKPVDTDAEQCPFLIDEANVAKIKKAKDIVIARMDSPPTLKDLANEVGINLKRLKTGFKQIYGDSVYSFLFDYKMEYARQLLVSEKYNVDEVGRKIGYSTSSHFIAAFKKKFGITPKKYLMSMNGA